MRCMQLRDIEEIDVDYLHKISILLLSVDYMRLGII